MKLQFGFLVFRGEGNTSRYVKYVVSSPLELFNRLVNLRLRENLQLIDLRTANGQRLRVVASLPHRQTRTRGLFNGRNLVFTADDLTDMERLDQLSGRVWEAIEQHFAKPQEAGLIHVYDRTNNKVPVGFRK